MDVRQCRRPDARPPAKPAGTGRASARLLVALLGMLVAGLPLMAASNWPMYGENVVHSGQPGNAVPMPDATPGVRWSLKLSPSASFSATPAMTPDNAATIVGTDDGRLLWIDMATGAVIRTVSSVAKTPFRATPLVSADGTVMAANLDGRLYARMADGTEWHVPTTTPWGPLAASPMPITIGRTAYTLVASMDGNLYLVGATEIAGAVRTGNVVTLTTAVPHQIMQGANILVVNSANPSFDGAFTAKTVNGTTLTYDQVHANEASGAGGYVVEWRKIFAAGNGIESTPAIGTPIAGTTASITQDLPAGQRFVMVAVGDAGNFAVGDEVTLIDGVGGNEALAWVTAVNTGTGRIDVTLPAINPHLTANNLQLASALTPVYFGCNNGRVYAIQGNQRAPGLRWMYPSLTTQEQAFIAAPVVLTIGGQEFVCIGDRSGRFYIITGSTGVRQGSALWDTQVVGTLTTAALSHDPVAGRDYLFAGFEGSGLAKVDVTDLNSLALTWLPAPFARVSAPPVGDTVGHVLVGGEDGKVYCLKSTGAGYGIRWSWPRAARGAAIRASAIVADTDTVLVPTTDGYLICLDATGTATVPPASKVPLGPWPTFQRNDTHTGSLSGNPPAFNAPGSLSSSTSGTFAGTKLRWAMKTGGMVFSSIAVTRNSDAIRNTTLADAIPIPPIGTRGGALITVDNASNLHVGDILVVGDNDYLGPITAILPRAVGDTKDTIETTYGPAEGHAAGDKVQVSLYRRDSLKGGQSHWFGAVTRSVSSGANSSELWYNRDYRHDPHKAIVTLRARLIPLFTDATGQPLKTFNAAASNQRVRFGYLEDDDAVSNPGDPTSPLYIYATLSGDGKLGLRRYFYGTEPGAPASIDLVPLLPANYDLAYGIDVAITLSPISNGQGATAKVYFRLPDATGAFPKDMSGFYGNPTLSYSLPTGQPGDTTLPSVIYPFFRLYDFTEATTTATNAAAGFAAAGVATNTATDNTQSAILQFTARPAGLIVGQTCYLTGQPGTVYTIQALGPGANDVTLAPKALAAHTPTPADWTFTATSAVLNVTGAMPTGLAVGNRCYLATNPSVFYTVQAVDTGAKTITLAAQGLAAGINRNWTFQVGGPGFIGTAQDIIEDMGTNPIPATALGTNAANSTTVRFVSVPSSVVVGQACHLSSSPNTRYLISAIDRVTNPDTITLTTPVVDANTNALWTFEDAMLVGPGSGAFTVYYPERFLHGDLVQITYPGLPTSTIRVAAVYGDALHLDLSEAKYQLLASYPPGSQLWVGQPGRWVAYVGSDDGYLRAVDPETGPEDGYPLWKNSAGSALGAVRGTPAIDTAHARIYVTSGDGRLFAFAQNGQFLWAYPGLETPSLDPLSGSPVLDENGNIFITTGSGKLYKITPDGIQATNGGVPVVFLPANAADRIEGGVSLYRLVSDNPSTLRVVFGTNSGATGKLISLDANLAKKWEFATSGPMVATPVIGADGTVVIGDTGDAANVSRVYAVYEDPAWHDPLAGNALLADWTVSTHGGGGTSTVANGAATLSPTDGTTSSVAIQHVATNADRVDVRAKITPRNGTKAGYLAITIGSGAIVDTDGGTSAWQHTSLGRGYVLSITPGALVTDPPLLELARRPGPGAMAIPLGSATPAIDVTVTHAYALEIIMGTVRVYVDGELLISAQDANYTTGSVLIAQGENATDDGGVALIDQVDIRDDAMTPVTRWTYITDGPVTAAAAMAADVVYVGDQTGKLHAITGTTQADVLGSRLALNGAITGPITLDLAGNLVVSTAQGNVYCLGGLDKWTGPTHYGTNTSIVPPATTLGAPWANNTPYYNPTTQTLMLRGRIKPGFTDNGGVALTQFRDAADPGGQLVLFGFNEDDAAVQDLGGDPASPIYAHVYLTDTGKIGVRRFARDTDPGKQEVTLALTDGRTLSDGIEVTLILAAASSATVRATAYYRVADVNGNFSGPDILIGTYVLPSGQPGDLQLPTTLYPFLQAMDADALQPGYTATGEQIDVYRVTQPSTLWSWNAQSDGGMPASLPIHTGPALWMGDVVMVGSDDGNVYAIGLKGTNTNPSGPDKTILLPAGVWPLFHRDPRRQGSLDAQLPSEPGPDHPTLRWFAQHETGLTSTPVVTSKTPTGAPRVYQGDGNGNLFAYDASTGTRQWTVVLPGKGPIRATPAIHTNGMVALGASDGRLYQVKPAGTLLTPAYNPVPVGGTYTGTLLQATLPAPAYVHRVILTTKDAGTLKVIGNDDVTYTVKTFAALSTATTTDLTFSLGRFAKEVRWESAAASTLSQFDLYGDILWESWAANPDPALFTPGNILASPVTAKDGTIYAVAADALHTAGQYYADGGVLPLSVAEQTALRDGNDATEVTGKTRITYKFGPTTGTTLTTISRVRVRTRNAGTLLLQDADGTWKTFRTYKAETAPRYIHAEFDRRVTGVEWQCTSPTTEAAVQAFEVYTTDGVMLTPTFTPPSPLVPNQWPNVTQVQATLARQGYVHRIFLSATVAGTVSYVGTVGTPPVAVAIAPNVLTEVIVNRFLTKVVWDSTAGPGTVTRFDVYGGGGRAYAFNPTTGGLVWQSDPLPTITGSPAVVAGTTTAQDILYVGTAEGQILAITGGKVAWVEEGAARVDASPVLVERTTGVSDVLVGDANGSIYFLQGDTGAPVSSSWPRLKAVNGPISNAFLVSYARNTVSAPAPVGNTRVSIATGGAQGNNASRSASMSADGRYIAFISAAANLVGGDGNGANDVFRRDRTTGQTTRVSVTDAGAEGNGDSYDPAISADGLFVAFTSAADNLVPAGGDTNAATDVFVRDCAAGTTERVSVATGGTEANGNSWGAAISADGRFVAFASAADNLVGADTNGTFDVFVRDRQLGTTERVSVSTGGGQSDGTSTAPSMSADGQLITFDSDATNLIGGDLNTTWDVFVHDRGANTTTCVSLTGAGAVGDGQSVGGAISADGRYVLFQSQATNLVADDVNGVCDVFLRDRQTGATERISVSSSGLEADDDSSLHGGRHISADGRYVVFESDATNLVLGDTNSWTDVFLRDRQEGLTTRASLALDWNQPNGNSAASSISSDGQTVVYDADASNLVNNDSNGTQDVFVRSAAPAQTIAYARNAYLVSDLGSVYRIDNLLTGDLTLLRTLPTSVQSSPVMDSVGHLFVGSDFGILYCLDGNDGTLLWSYMPNRSSIATTLYKDVNPEVYLLPVASTTGFRVGDPVEITHADGSLPESLGEVTQIIPPGPSVSTTLRGITGMATNESTSWMANNAASGFEATGDATNTATDGATDTVLQFVSMPDGVIVGQQCHLTGQAVLYTVKTVDPGNRRITLLPKALAANTTAVSWTFDPTSAVLHYTTALPTGVAVGQTCSPTTDALTIYTIQAIDTVAKTITLAPKGLLENLTDIQWGYGTGGAVLHFATLPVPVAPGAACYMTNQPDPKTMYQVQSIDPVGKTITLMPQGLAANAAAVSWTFSPVITNTLQIPVASAEGMKIGDDVSVLPWFDPVTGTPEAVRFVGKIAAITSSDTHTADVIVLDRALTENYSVGSQVIAGAAYGYLRVSSYTRYRRDSGDIIRVVRGLGSPIRTSPSIGPSQIIYVGTNDGFLYAVGPIGPAGQPKELPPMPVKEDASPWWTFHKDNQRSGYADRPGPLYPDLRWYRYTGSTMESSPALGYPDDSAPLGVLYVGTADEPNGGFADLRGSMLALDASTGSIRWRFDDNKRMGRVLSSPAVFVSQRSDLIGLTVKDEMVVFGTADLPGNTTAPLLDATVLDTNGNELSVANDLLNRTGILAGDKLVAVKVSSNYPFDDNMEVFISDLNSGSNFEVLGTIRDITSDGMGGRWLWFEEAYVARQAHTFGISEITAQTTQQGHLYCVDRSGRLRWKFPDEHAVASERIGTIRSSPVVDTEGTSYFATDEGIVYAVDSAGKEVWNYQVEHRDDRDADMQISSSPALNLAGTRLFIGISVPQANRGYLLALDATTTDNDLRKLWMIQLAGPVTASPMITTVDQNERLYIGTDNKSRTANTTGKLYAINPATGTILATLDRDATNGNIVIGPITSTAAAIPESEITRANGQLILVGSLDRKLYAFRRVNTPNVNTKTFTGPGLDDLTLGATYTGAITRKYLVQIDSVGAQDTFKWTDDGGLTWTSKVGITGAAQALSHGVTITFTAITGHTLNNYWTFYARSNNVPAIESANFDGVGLNDLTTGGVYTGTTTRNFRLKIDGTNGLRDSFVWSQDDGVTWSPSTQITGAAQALGTSGVTVTFGAFLGHTIGDAWFFSACCEKLQVVWTYATGGPIRTSPAISTIPPLVETAVYGGGGGLDDLTSGGTFTAATTSTYQVQIDGTGTPNTFKWTDDNITWHRNVRVTGLAQTLSNGVTVKFANTTGHALNDAWSFTATPVAYRAYVGSNDYRFYAVNFSGTTCTLAPNWPRNLRDRQVASPAVGMRSWEAGAGIVYQASRDRYVYAFGDQVDMDNVVPQPPDGSDLPPYTPPEESADPLVPSTVEVVKSAERYGLTAPAGAVDPSPGVGMWWKFVLKVQNAGRGVVDTLKVYDTFPLGLAFGPLDIAGQPAPYPVGLQADEAPPTITNKGTTDKPQWEIVWTNLQGGAPGSGFTLTPDLQDPAQNPSAYSRTFTFFAKVSDGAPDKNFMLTTVSNPANTTSTIRVTDPSHLKPSMVIRFDGLPGTDITILTVDTAQSRITISQAISVAKDAGIYLASNATVTENLFLQNQGRKDVASLYASGTLSKKNIQRQIGQAMYLQFYNHPTPGGLGGNLGLNQLVVNGKTYRGTRAPANTITLKAHKETPVQNEWTDTFEVRFYYNGYHRASTLWGGLAGDGQKARIFSPWNQVNPVTGMPLMIRNMTSFKSSGRNEGFGQIMKSYPSPVTGQDWSNSEIQMLLIPKAKRFDQIDLAGVGKTLSLTPYGWRMTIRQVKTRMGGRDVEWGPEVPLLKRIEFKTAVTANANVGATTVSISRPADAAEVTRLLNLQYHYILFDNPDPAVDAEVYVRSVNAGANPVVLTVSPLTSAVETGAVIRDEWSPDVIVQNPVGMSGPTTVNGKSTLTVGSTAAPGHTATSPNVDVTNIWSAGVTPPPHARFLFSPGDLRDDLRTDWNAQLDAEQGYTFGALPTAGVEWDGLRYDPFRENNITMPDDTLDLPQGLWLQPGQKMRIHITRRVPAHQAPGTFSTEIEPTAVFTFDDINGDGNWDRGERLYYGVVPVSPTLFDTRVYIDMNGNRVWDSGEPYYIPNAPSDYASRNTETLDKTSLGTALAISPATRLSLPKNVLELGGLPLGSPDRLPLENPVLVNTGNTVLGGAGLPSMSAATTLATTTADGTTIGAHADALLRTGSPGVKLATGLISLRHVSEIQPYLLRPTFPTGFSVLKSPAGAAHDYGRPFELPVSTGFRQPTGTYTGEVTVGGAGVQDHFILSLRVRETCLSQTVPGLAQPPVFDYYMHRSAAMQGWTNYLTGTESWPTAAVLTKGNDDLGVWVASNTPLGDAPIAPTNTTDTNLWFRRPRHLTTAMTAIDQSTLVATGQITVTVDPAVASLIRNRDDITSDLIILRVKPKIGVTPDPTTWYGRVTAANTTTGALTLTSLMGTTTWAAAATDSLVEMLSHPWIPVLSTTEMTALRARLADPGVVVDPGPTPIRCTMPAVTLDAARDPWLVWTVSGVRRVTQNGRVSTQPASFLAYKRFDPDDPNSAANVASLIGTQDLTAFPLRENPLLLTTAKNLPGLVLYAAGTANARGLYYGCTRLPLTNPAWSKMDQPLGALNWTFSDVSHPQAWVDSDPATGDPVAQATGLNLVFQARSVDGNTDLYYTRMAQDTADPTKWTVTALGLAAGDATGGQVTEVLTPSAGNTLFTGSQYLAWTLFNDDLKPPAQDPPRFKLTVKTVSQPGGTDITMKKWVELPASAPTGVMADSRREYVLEFQVGAQAFRLGVDPYRGVVRVLRATEAVTEIAITGMPRIQRLTTNLAPDVNPMVSVERWRYFNGGSRIFDAANTLKTAPRVWIYWARQHEDGLGTRVYYRTVRVGAQPGTNNPRLVSEVRGGTGTVVNVDMPERMLPMDVLAPDGSVFIGRQSATVNSPEAGLWVLSTASRNLESPYYDPAAGAAITQSTLHDLFLQVINVPVPDN